MEVFEDLEKYSSDSKVHMDIFIFRRLDGNETTEVIDYNSKNMRQFGIY